MNDLDYSDKFWKNSEKNTQKKSYKKNITFVLDKTYYNEF